MRLKQSSDLGIQKEQSTSAWVMDSSLVQHLDYLRGNRASVLMALIICPSSHVHAMQALSIKVVECQ